MFLFLFISTTFLFLIVLSVIFKEQLRIYFKGGQCIIKKNLKDYVAIITGSNTGIGYETALALANNNCTVILACRNQQRGETAQKKLIQETKNNSIYYLQLDLADLKSIDQFVQNFLQKFDRLDMLINNAGVMWIPKKELTKDGFEQQVGINHIGHFHLTTSLMPILEKTAIKTQNVRVVTVSSIAYMQNFGKIQWNNFMAQQSYDRKAQYTNSKLCNLYFTKYLSQHKKSDNIKFLAVHPGVVETEIFQYVLENKVAKIFFNLIEPLAKFVMKTPKDGAQTSIHCAVSDFKALKCGAFYSDCEEKELYAFAEDKQEIEKLWKLSQSYVNGALQKYK